MSGASKRGGRRLTILDVMLLIAATAGGLAATRVALRAFQGPTAGLTTLFAPELGWDAQRVLLRAIGLVVLGLTVFGPWTFLLPILRLRRPRPAWRRLTSQPGFLACLAAAFGIALGAVGTNLGYLCRSAYAGPYSRLGWPTWMRVVYLNDLIGYAGLSVATAWAVLAIQARWRPVPDAIDRLGRALGVLWIVAGVVWGVRHYVFL